VNWTPVDLMVHLTKRHDIFLSHSIVDRNAVAKAHARITAEGYSVYVEWIVDDDLGRCGMVAIPTMEEEDARRPSRERECLVNERSRTHRLVPPPLDQSQQCCRIRFQFLQRLALYAGNSAAHQPAPLAHLDDHHQGRDRIKRGQTSAEIIDVGHGVTSISSYGR
jgi:hypothetical protein